VNDSFRGLVASALLVVACGSDTSEESLGDPPDATPGVENPLPDAATSGGTGAAPISVDDDGGGGAGGAPDESADGGNGADAQGEDEPNDSAEPEVLALEPCDLNAPFEAATAAFTGSMLADGLTFSADGNTAYISGPGTGGNDIFVATRQPNGTFSTPTRVDVVSTPGKESAPSLSADGLTLYLSSNTSSGAVGATDIARSVWQGGAFISPQSLGAPFNSSVHDQDPFWWGSDTVYFVSERPEGAHRDIYVSRLSGTPPTFSEPTRVPGVDLHSDYEEFRPVVSPDGLTIYYSSRRYVGIGNDTSGDIFMARRPATDEPFAQSVNLWNMNTSGIDFPVTVSADGCTLYFATSEETGLGASQNFRLYQAKRGTSTPAQVTLRLNILGQGSVAYGPLNCGPGNTGTCSASAPPDTAWNVYSSAPAQWTGNCASNGGVPSTDGILVFSQNAVCTVKFPGAPLVGPGGLCSLSMDCQQGLQCVNGTCGCAPDTQCSEQGDTCSADADCQAGLVCWLEGARHFDKPGGTGVCAPQICRTSVVAGGCGDLTQPCGRCEGTPRPCTTNADCVVGEVCGTDNGADFGLAPDGDFCWPPDCNTPATTPSRCGTVDSACGLCDCSANCAGRVCGDSTDDGCGGTCSGLCEDREPCTSSFDCPAGSVCGLGVGPRFGLPAGTSACWPADCADQDPSLPNGGVDTARCGVSPPCAPTCESGDTGPDGCGGFCGNCATGEVRHEDGVCGPPVTFIHRSGVDLPEPFDPIPTNEVGATPGSFSVTDRGHASYSIGLQVPPGRLGVQPNLAIRYLSTKADGMLGIGWSLTGLSTVTRCRRILDRDGGNVAIGFGPGDLFCLDGQALKQVGVGNYGDDGVEYRTEIDSFSKIVSHGSLFDSNGNYKGPDWFEVRTKDGWILTLGRSGFSKVTVGGGPLSRIWGLNRVEDHAGNYLDIRYRNHISVRVISNSQLGVTTELTDTGELLPDTISYGGNLSARTNGLPGWRHTRFVSFVYENRSDPTHHYVAGVQGYSRQRLTRVDISVGPELVKSYNLVYELAFQPHQLAFVQECGKDIGGAQKCLPTTKLDYFAEESIGTEQEIRSITNPTPLVIVLDQNGDGLDEVLGWDRSAHWSLGSPVVGRVRDGLPFTQTSPVLAANPFTGACLGQSSVLDLNRDGRDDLVDLCHPNAHIAAPNGWATRTINVPDTSGRKRLADVDGDSLRDLVWCVDEQVDGYRYGRVSFARNTGTDFQTPDILPLPTLQPDPACVPVFDEQRGFFTKTCGVASCDGFLATDVDEDGDDDLLLTQTSLRQIVRSIRVPVGPGFVDVWESFGPQLPSPDYYRMLDFNGDGLKDFLSFDGTIFTLWANTGEGFVQQRMEMSATTSQAPSGFDRSIVVDYDGDGREDLLLPPVWVRFAGPGRIEKREAPGLPPILVAPADPVQPGRERAVLADFDGDGSQELVYDLGRKTAQLGRSGRAHLLATVTDGLGKRFAFQYEGLYDPPIDGRYPEPPSIRGWVRTYDPSECEATATTTCQRKVGPLVSSYSTSQVWNGPGGVETEPGPTILYQYFGSRGGLRGRGSFGFSSRVVEGPITQTTYEYHNDDFVLAGRLQKIASLPFLPAPSPLGNEARFEETTFQWSIFQSGAHHPFPYLSEQTHTVFDGAQQRAVVQRSNIFRFAPDAFGNEHMVVTTNSSATEDVDVTTVMNTPIIDSSTWNIGLFDSRTIASTRGGQTQRRFIDYQYDIDRRLLTGIVREGGQVGAIDPAQHRSTALARDDFGNVHETCVEDSSGSPRCTEVVTRDSENIFPKELRTDNITREYIFAVEDGQLLAVIDPNGNTSARAFDAFGRLQQVRTATSEGTVEYSAAPRGESVFEDFFVDGAIAVTRAFIGEGPRASIFDAFGRLVKTESPGPDGAVVVHEVDYDHLGRLVRSSVPHAPDNSSEGLTQYEYDPVGRLSKITQPDGNATEYFYTNVHASNSNYESAFDEGGATLSLVKLPRGNTRLTVVDATGLVSKTSEAANVERVNATATNFQRGPFGEVRNVLAPQGHTSYEIDDWGRTLSVVDPALGTRSFVYNGFDEIVQETDALGQVESFAYDNLGRITEKRDDAGNIIALWDYDGEPALARQGRLVGAWRRTATDSDTGTWILNHYEGPDGLPSAVEYHLDATLAAPSGGDVFMTQFEYDPEVRGRVSKISYPSNGGALRVGYDYDPNSGMPERVFQVDSQGNETEVWALVSADEGYRLGEERFGNGVVSTRSYFDPADCAGQPGLSCAGRLREITTAPPGEGASTTVAHTWDRNGNLAGLQRDNTPPFFYEYDSLDRLTREYITAGPENDLTVRGYAYNDAGDLTSKTGAGTFSYVPRTSGNGVELQSVGDTTYTYDENGNQIERTGSLALRSYQKLDYNDFDMPYQITSGEEGIDRSVTSLEYTATGQRVRERTTNSGITTERVYIGNLYQRTENMLTPSTAEHRYKVLVGSRQVAEIVRRGNDGEDDDIFYLHDDHLGSTTGISDASGGFEQRSYEPFGTMTSSGTATGVRSSFTGHDADTAVGLVNARGRLYDPKIGRFISPDPFVTNPSSSQGWNRYSYVLNNPLTFTDPTGFNPCDNIMVTCTSEGQCTYNAAAVQWCQEYYSKLAQEEAADAQAQADEDAEQARQEAMDEAQRQQHEAQAAYEASERGFDMGQASAAAGQPPPGYNQPTIGPPPPPGPQPGDFGPPPPPGPEWDDVCSVSASCAAGDALSDEEEVEGYMFIGRLPDFYQLEVSVGSVLNMVIDREGQVYLGFGTTIGAPTGSAQVGWMNQLETPSAAELEDFLSGWGVSVVGGYRWFGAGQQFSSGASGTTMGITKPGFSFTESTKIW
jgi:RHS repeat-associated protein